METIGTVELLHKTNGKKKEKFFSTGRMKLITFIKRRARIIHNKNEKIRYDVCNLYILRKQTQRRMKMELLNIKFGAS